jgi:hypothetical protein
MSVGANCLILNMPNYFSLFDSQGSEESFLVNSNLLTELLNNFTKLFNLFNLFPVLDLRHRRVSVIALSYL